MILVDASVLANALADDAIDGDTARRALTRPTTRQCSEWVPGAVLIGLGPRMAIERR